MKIATSRAEAFLARPDPDLAIVLLYGPDAGLVEERAVRLCRAVCPDLTDPFRVTEITGDQLEREPMRLVEEAQALCMLGGRRVVRVRRALESTARALEPLAALARQEAFTVIEADDLGGSSKLRQLAERAKSVAAIGCYRDEDRTIEALITKAIADDGLTIDRDALSWLAAHLGNDRGISRRELEKLTVSLWDRTDKRVRLADVEAIVGDSFAASGDDFALATLQGDQLLLDRYAGRLLGAGEPPVRLLRTISSMVSRLLRLRLEIDRGVPIDRVLETARPPVFFRLKDRMRSVLQRFPSSRLVRISEMLLQCEIAMKRARSPDELLLRRTLDGIALQAQSGRTT